MSLHLGWCSPLPPAQSGIADYSAELLPAIAQRCAVTGFVSAPAAVLPQLRAHLRLRPLDDILQADEILPVYHLGNHVGFHADILKMALRRPGVLVLHEYVLHDLVQRIFLGAGQVDGFRQWVRASEPKVDDRRLRSAVRCELPQADMPLCEPLVQASRSTVVLNTWAAGELTRRCPASTVTVVRSHAISAPHVSADRVELRRRYRLPERGFIAGSFGHQTPNKRLDVALRAFAQLRREFSDSLYILAGPPSARFDAQQIAAQLGIGDAVRTFGYVQEAMWWELMACTDLCVSLRGPTQGETSASVLKQLSAGKAVCVSAAGPDLDFPGDVVCHIPQSDDETDQLWLAMRRAATDITWREELGERARRYVREQHSVDRAADAMVAVCEHARLCVPQDDSFDIRPALHRTPPLQAACNRWVYRWRLARAVRQRHGWRSVARRLAPSGPSSV